MPAEPRVVARVTAAVAFMVAGVVGVGLLSPDARAGLAAARDALTGGRTASGTGHASPPGRAPSGTAVLAFAGDVHFAGSSRAALGGDLGSAATVLAQADLAVVNLETAVTSRGTPEPKQYVFRAPASAMRVLRDAGVDAVSVANNHGMDYGRVGFADTLAASARYHLPVIGGGKDVAAAYTPYRATVHGVRVAVLSATDVLDDFAIATWPATATRSGLASTKDPARLLAAVRAARGSADVVVVMLHWGVEKRTCPTARQRDLARRLTAAGAAVVVGSHAHVLGPDVRRGTTAVHYGLGNFVFYADGTASTQTGVFTVTVDRSGVVGTAWHPAVIRSGRPQLLSGDAAAAASARETALAATCGVA